MDIRLDEGFLFGMGAFETIAVEKGKPILLEKHIERLEKAADFLQLGSCSARGFSKEKVFSYLASQDSEMTDHGVLKIVCSAENLFFQMRTNTYSEEDYAKGFVADISKVRRNETSSLVYHKNMIYTPQLSCGLLPGILREYVMSKFSVVETIIYPDELMYYEECFVTNSLMGVMPVRQLGNICFPHRTRAEEVRNTYESEKMSL